MSKRTLNTKRIPKVVLLIETSREYGRQLLRGIAKYSRLHGPWTFYREPGGLSEQRPPLGKREVDGIMVRGDSLSPEEVRQMGVPVIFASRARERIPGFSCIMMNSVAVGRMGAEHLLERGFRHFGFCGFSDLPSTVRRRRAFVERIRQAGYRTRVCETPESLSISSWARERDAIADWLRALPKPAGIMACHDYRGQHVLECCKVAGLHVPEEVAVIGAINDDIFCDLCDPPLSSIAFNIEKAGYEAAALLDKLMRGEKTSQRDIIIQPTHVVVRQSTDILAIDDKATAMAICFIRQHAKEPIQVSDVVEAADLSRRALEQRFRKTVGRSMLQEIRRLRVEQVARLLLETDMSVTQIASTLGFSDEKHISRPFRQEKGMSPLAFRRVYSLGSMRRQ
jgi:LacI family transcriptional regulator